MSISNGLVPERRADKNGRITTRWVKPVVALGTGRRIPSPTTSSVSQTPLLDAIIIRANLDSTSLTLGPSVISALEGMLSATDSRHDVADIVFGALKEVRDFGEKTQVNNLAVFGEDLASFPYVKDRIHMYVQGLHNNGLFTEIDDFLLEANDEQRSQAKALVRFANEVDPPWTEHYFGYDETDPGDSIENHSESTEEDHCVRVAGKTKYELCEFILRNHEQVDEVIKAVKERGATDIALLDRLLNHDEQALRSGLL